MGPKLLRLALILVSCLGPAAAATATPTFQARRDYPVSGGTNTVAVADVNGDGVADILSMSGPYVDVLLGNGNGTFRPGPTTNAGGGTGPPVVVDFAGSGVVDLVMPYGGGVCVSLGNGDGTFQQSVCYAAGANSQGTTVVVGDFNRDGILDVASVSLDGIWLFLGQGGGVLGPGTLTPFTGAWERYNNLAGGDFSGNGNMDLAVVTTTGLAVFAGNGNGTFQPPYTITTPTQPGWVTAGDVNGDGRADLVVTSNSSPYVSLYLGAPGGGFTGPTYVNLPGSTAVVIGDVNGDGISDLVNPTAYVALGKSNGKFRTPVFYAVQSFAGPYNAALGDLRNNGRTDIVVQGSSQTVSVLLNVGHGVFQDAEWTPVAGGAGCGAVADYNGDGKPDLAVNTPSGVTILLGTGNAKSPFTAGTSIALPNADCVTTGDLNGDGIPDLLVPAYTGSGYVVHAYLGKGDGTFTLKSSMAVATPGYLALADFNHDGKLDFASSGNLFALGNGDGTFQAPQPITTPTISGFSNIAAGDLNGTGWASVVLTGSFDNRVYVLLNNQKGGFGQSVIQAGFACIQVLLADLKNDGNLDFIVTAAGGGAVVYLGNGKGGFTKGETLNTMLPVGIAAVAAIADVNGDGISDIVLDEGPSVAVFLGKGNAQFSTPSVYFGAGPSAASVYTGNLHGQAASAGLADIVVPDFSGGVTVLINKTK
jgi:hypothetical protein